MVRPILLLNRLVHPSAEGSLAEMPLLEPICIIFLDGLPTVNRPLVRHKNPVFREEVCHGGGIIVVVCLIKLLASRIKLLAELWIDCVFLYRYHYLLRIFSDHFPPNDLPLDFSRCGLQSFSHVAGATAFVQRAT